MIEAVEAAALQFASGAALADPALLAALGEADAEARAPTLQQALAQTGGCGCPGRAPATFILAEPQELSPAGQLPGDSAPAADAEAAFLVDREPAYSRLGDGFGLRQTALWLVEPEPMLLLADAGQEPILADAVLPAGKDWLLRASTSLEGEEEEIFVDGKRIRETGGGGTDPGTGGDPTTGGGDTGMGGGGYGDPGDDAIAQRVTIDDSVPESERERAEEMERKIEEKMREIDRRIKALPDNAVVTVGDKTLTGAEIKSAWAKISIVITWRMEEGPIGTGANTDGVYLVTLSSLEDLFSNSGKPGYSTVHGMFIHELAHVLPWVNSYYASQWQSYLDRGGSRSSLFEWQNSEEFKNGERYTHAWAVEIAGYLEVSIYTP